MSRTKDPTEALALQYASTKVGRSRLVHADCFEWMGRLPEHSLHAIVTDPPYGVKEYDFDQLEKRANGNGGIWRIPPSFDGHMRAPLPRFTALDEKGRARLRRFFVEWAEVAVHALRPGGHVFIATNAFLAQLLYGALVEGGLEFRGQVVRLVRTLRGGDRPKNAEEEFAGVSSMPRGCYEPWGLLRKPLPRGMRVSDCLREFQTGGLRRTPGDKPFGDLIVSERTPQRERRIANHPSLKPQTLLRELVHAALPLGEGVVADPFMGSGSTVAAAEAVGVSAIGAERFADYYKLAVEAVPRLAALPTSGGTDGPDWTPSDEEELRALARQNTPTRVMGLKLGRTADAVLKRAGQMGVSLRPSNQLRHNRRKRSARGDDPPEKQRTLFVTR